MILSLVTPPAISPVSLADMKAHLRVDAADEDALIQLYIDAAVAAVDARGKLGRAMITQTWDQAFQNPGRDVCLSILPVQSLVSVKYYDSANALQTANLADFTLYTGADWAFVRSTSWPAAYDRPDAITVQYKAGYGDLVTDVPATVVQAIKLMVAGWYENREDFRSGFETFALPRGAEELLGLTRLGWYG